MAMADDLFGLGKDKTDELLSKIIEARQRWTNVMAQYAEIPAAEFEAAFNEAVLVGAAYGRIEGILEMGRQMLLAQLEEAVAKFTEAPAP